MHSILDKEKVLSIGFLKNFKKVSKARKLVCLEVNPIEII